MPEKLHQLQRLFLIEAVKYNVLPLDDRKGERFNAELAGRPVMIHGNTQLLFAGMRGLSENNVLNVKNKSSAVTAQLVIPGGGGNGVIIAQGGRFGGWSLYLKEGRPAYCYNLLGLQQFRSKAKSRSPPASTKLGWNSATTAAGSARVAPSRSTSMATSAARGGLSAASR
jgi:hypothetical protein